VSAKTTMAQKAAIAASLDTQVIERCEDCSGWVAPGRFEYIRLPLRGEDGNPIYDMDGTPRYTKIAMKSHVLPPTRHDPTGLVAVTCDHGIKTHPDPEIQGSQSGRSATSWVRSRYVRLGPPSGTTCPVCRGEERPADMTESLPA
jgi:hypothetical protein